MFGNPLPTKPNPNNYNFSKVPNVDLPRSTFKRPSRTLTAIDAGDLVPVFVDDIIPGDTFQMKSAHLGRLTTPIYPLMDDLHLDIHYFFVPYRIIQDNFVKIHGERDNPSDSIDFLTPKVDLSGGVSEGSLYDYFGFPTGSVYNSNPNNYAGRAYNLIWNEYFRDQNLQDSITVDKDDGTDTASDYVIRKRGKRHDYFTSCLPWPQKGDAVSLPLGTSAPILGLYTNDTAITTGTMSTDYVDYNGNNSSASDYILDARDGQSSARIGIDIDGTTPDVRADLSSATAATINELRLAFQTQKVLEKDARGGTRYIEHLKSHYGVTSPDFRLQRPEFLGSSSSRVDVQQVPQTSSTDVTTPQGNLSAYATVVSRADWNKSFTEHGIVIGLASLRANLTYQQGLNRMHSYSSRFDFYYPSLSHIGEQAVLNKEIYAQGTSADDDVFGYQEAWAHLRYKPSMITGVMRSNAATPLDAWHLAQDFGSLPSLNSSFIEENPPMDRVLAVSDEPDLLLDNYFELKCTRVMPLYSIPGLIDHF